MQLVVPSAVSIADMMLARICSDHFRISFFFILFTIHYSLFTNEGAEGASPSLFRLRVLLTPGIHGHEGLQALDVRCSTDLLDLDDTHVLQDTSILELT